MANTAGGPFGGLLNSPELWDKLLQSFGSIGRYLSAPPGPSLGENALRDISQIGVTAPLGVPGAIGLSAVGEGMRPPWEQSTLQIPERGLETASDLSKLALRDPMMLQKLATSALLGGPSAFQQAFHEHPVLTPLMAIPILPGGKEPTNRIFKKDLSGRIFEGLQRFLNEKDWTEEGTINPSALTANELKQYLAESPPTGPYAKGELDYRAAILNEAMKRGLVPTDWGRQQLENALQRIADRERRIRRKLTQHEVEDVIQQAMSERPTVPGVGKIKRPDLARIPWEQLRQRYVDFMNEHSEILGEWPQGLAKERSDMLYELRRRSPSAPSSQSAQVSKEELLHQFEEGPGGPLPPITTGKEPPPPPSPEEIGGQMLRNEGWTPGEMGLARPVQPEPPPDIFDVVREAKGIEFPWQERVQQLLDNEWRRAPKTGPLAGPIDVRFGTNFLNTYAGREPVGTKFSYKGQDFMRLKRGWSYIPRGEGPQTFGELGKQVTGGSDLLNQVPLSNQPPTPQQQIVAKLTDMNRSTAFQNLFNGEWWEGGQRFILGKKGWMADPNQSISPIQHIEGQTILPRPEGPLRKYLDRVVWRRYSPSNPSGPFTIDGTLETLNQITGSPRIAQFWLMQHIHQRQLEGKATPAEIVWFELQRGQRPPDEGMAGAKR